MQPSPSLYLITGTDPVRTSRDRIAVTSPDVAADVIRAHVRPDRETCITLVLDTKHRLLEAVVTSIGSVDHTFTAPREIFRDALCRGASAIVVGHNHPSGDVSPSADDRAVTRRLVAAGKLLGVAVLDHIIVSSDPDDGFTSLARLGDC